MLIDWYRDENLYPTTRGDSRSGLDTVTELPHRLIDEETVDERSHDGPQAVRDERAYMRGHAGGPRTTILCQSSITPAGDDRAHPEFTKRDHDAFRIKQLT